MLLLYRCSVNSKNKAVPAGKYYLNIVVKDSIHRDDVDGQYYSK